MAVHLITTDYKFNKSLRRWILNLTLSNIFQEMGNSSQLDQWERYGLANHNYYQKKDIYWDMFRSIWDKLRSEG